MYRTLAAAVILVVLLAAIMAAVGCAKKAPVEDPPASVDVPAGPGNVDAPVDDNAVVDENAEPAVDENAEPAAENSEAPTENAG